MKKIYKAETAQVRRAFELAIEHYTKMAENQLMPEYMKEAFKAEVEFYSRMISFFDSKFEDLKSFEGNSQGALSGHTLTNDIQI